MEGSTGCTNPFGVRNWSFGSRRDPMSVFNLQLGEKRRASCPAAITQMNPITKMMMTMIQSFRSCSTAFIFMFIDRQSHINCCAGICHFIVSRALQPDASMVGIDNPARNGKPQSRSAALEFGLARGMQKNFAGLVELLKDEFLVLRVDANAGVLNGDLDLGQGTASDRPPTDGNPASIGRVFDGIADHVIKDLV